MIYLDHAASTPLHPELQDELISAFKETGNSQSKQQPHLKAIINISKAQIAKTVQCDTNRIFFTSGASESINTALIGAANFYKNSGNHIISFATEHQVVLKALTYLGTIGFKVTILDVLPNGSIDYKVLEKTITPSTILISLNHVCNETGHVHQLEPLCDLRKKHGFMLHVDACQSIGKVKLKINHHDLDFVSLSSHKCNGPQGIGALYIHPRRHITPLIHGSSPVRSGTMSHALIQLMGHAYEKCEHDYMFNLRHIQKLRHNFLSKLTDIPYHLNEENGVPHIVNICFDNANEQTIQRIREGIFCQPSSACFDGGASHVLKARKISLKDTLRSLRFSFGIHTTLKEINAAAQHIIQSHQ